MALGGVLLALGLGCLVTSRPGYAMLALALGLAGVLAGSIWSWWGKEE